MTTDEPRRARSTVLLCLLASFLFGSPGGVDAQESPGAPLPIEPVEVAEITAHGVEVSRARVLADAINAVLDTLPTLEGYEDWRTTLEGKGRPDLWAGNPMAVQGIYHLSEDDFFDWSLVRFRMIEHLLSEGGGLDTRTAARCAQLERGQADLPLKVELYNALDPELVQTLADLHARGWVAAGTREFPSSPTEKRLRETFRDLAVAIRGYEDASVRGLMNPEGSEELQTFREIVSYEIRGDGHIVDDRSLCHYAYHVWKYFPALDLDQQRALYFLHLGTRAAAERLEGPGDETGRGTRGVEAADAAATSPEAGRPTGPEPPARPEPIRPFIVDEISAHGIERAQAEILAEAFNAALDTLRALPGYEDWQATIRDQRPRSPHESPEIVPGVTRLSADDLLAWADLQRRWLSLFKEGVEDLDDLDYDRCRQFMRQQAFNEFEYGREIRWFYNDLAPEEMRRLAELQVDGLIAELGAAEPLPRVTAGELHEALVVLTRRLQGHAYDRALDRLTRTVRRVMGEAPSEPYALEPTTAGPTDREYCIYADATMIAASDLAPAHLRVLLRWLYDPDIR